MPVTEPRRGRDRTEWAATIEARREHIEKIGGDRLSLLHDLVREVAAGEVRTVRETYPPPVQGPDLPGYTWLLDQKEWWYPHRRPAVRVASMDKPWRWNTVRLLERKADLLHLNVGSRYMHDAPDDVWWSWNNEDPYEWLREQPLMRALGKGLPHPDSAKGRALAARAVHWNTCPMRKSHPGALDHCRCIRDGRGRVVAAHNDPDSIRRADLVLLNAEQIEGWLRAGQPRDERAT